MINFTELSGYFRDFLAFAGFLLALAYGLLLIYYHREKRAGWAFIVGFFFVIFDRLVWRLVNTFWLSRIHQVLPDYERIYVMIEIAGGAAFLLGSVLIMFALNTLVRSMKQEITDKG